MAAPADLVNDLRPVFTLNLLESSQPLAVWKGRTKHQMTLLSAPFRSLHGWFCIAALLLAAPPGTGAEPSKRPAWITSKVKGSPEPPSPYVTERIFPKLTFSEPVEAALAPGSSRIFLMELKGRVYSFPDQNDSSRPDLFVDLKTVHAEMAAAYGMAFHPKYAENGYVYLCYVLKDGDPNGTRVSRFTVRKSEPPTVDPASEVVLLTFLGGGHNGGCLRFGPDGCLYISTGDGAGPDPPDISNTGQDISDLLSSVLHIDVDHADPGKTYRVPADNPFITTPGARPEVWAYGLRNPWKMAFDPYTGSLWAGDVGWELWELVFRIQRGGNYGWSIMEGSKQVIKPDGKRGPTPITPPVVMHPHSEAASITGGFVYRGNRLKDLRGQYVYGDWETGKLWSFRDDGRTAPVPRELVDTPYRVIFFGERVDGDQFFASWDGLLYRLIPNPEAGQPSSFPRQLSKTGVFESLGKQQPAAGVLPYSVVAEPWADHAIGQRWLGLPGDSTVIVTNTPWVFPKDAVLVKTLELDMVAGDPRSRRKIETQLLHYNGDAWGAYSYRWNDAQTDAELVDKNGAERTFTVKDANAPGGKRVQTWRFHGRAECLRCHNSWCGTALGFNALQLNQPGNASNQLAVLIKQGIFNQLPATSELPVMRNPHDTSATLTERARTYLHVNCSPCHREHAGGSVMVFMNYEMPLAKTSLVGAKPAQSSFGMEDARVINPGDPCRSVLYYRTSKLGKGRMPYVGSHQVDEQGIDLLYQWIKEMKPAEPDARPAASNQAVAQLVAAKTGTVSDTGVVIDQLLGSVSGALAAVRAVDDHSVTGQTREALLARGTTHANPLVRDLFERYLPEDKRVKTLGTDIRPQAILSLKGDAQRGRFLFQQEGGAQCFTCHRAKGEGKDFGPDLSEIGRKYSKAQLLENILEPSKVIDPKFVAYSLDTKSELSHTGFIVKRDATEIVLKNANAELIHIPTGDLAKATPQKLSLMPEQLLQSLTAQQAADLLAYLMSLR